MKRKTSIAILMATLMIVSVYAETRTVSLTIADETVVEKGHLPQRSPAVRVIPSVTYDTDQHVLSVSVSSPASVRYVLTDAQENFIKEGECTVSGKFIIPTFNCQTGTHTISLYVSGNCYQGEIYIERE